MEAAYYSSPVGSIEIVRNSIGITSISFQEHLPENNTAPDSLIESVSQLDEYFSGRRREFSLPLAPEGTAFQKHVWQQLQAIPFGEKWSYRDIAIKLGDKNASRAVGAANGKNPIAIIIPCHRVIGEDGTLTGYAGGLWRKEWLLDFESKNPQVKLF